MHVDVHIFAPYGRITVTKEREPERGPPKQHGGTLGELVWPWKSWEGLVGGYIFFYKNRVYKNIRLRFFKNLRTF